MATPLQMEDVKDGFTRLYDPQVKDRNRVARFNRIWTTCFAVLSISFGIAFIVSCSTGPTSGMYMVSVNTSQFMLDITGSNTAMTDIWSNGSTSMLDELAQSHALLPTQYLFGFSGCCRIYKNSPKQCILSFPQSQDLLTTIITDLSGLSNTLIKPEISSFTPSLLASSDQNYTTTSKFYSYLIVLTASTILLTSITILSIPTRPFIHLIIAFPSILLSITVTTLYTTQLTSYPTTAISPGPGTHLLYSWTLATILLTPLTAIISLITISGPMVVLVWIGMLGSAFLTTCFADSGGEKGEDGYYNPRNPGGPDYNHSV